MRTLIAHGKYLIIFQTIEQHILNNYPILDDFTPLHEQADTLSKVFKDYMHYNYFSVEINGDWLRVQCDDNCDGCPENEIIQGWVRWRKNDKLLIKIGYFC